MFDTHYEFHKIQQPTEREGELVVTTHKFSFRSISNHRYIVDIEEYPCFLFSVQFCLKAHSNSERRFNEITSLEGRYSHRVFSTCLWIMRSIYDENPYASFTFIGAPLEGEKNGNTKRIRLYRKMMAALFSPVRFQHFLDDQRSCYLLLNNDNSEPDLKAKIAKIFKEQFYPDKDSEGEKHLRL